MTESIPPEPQDEAMKDADTQSPPEAPSSPKYGGFTRFEIELEFIQSLSSPLYLQHLASQKHLDSPAFIAYLSYLLYWTQPPYLKYLTYPGPSLRNLELLQNERFRKEILGPEVVGRLGGEMVESGRAWAGL